MSPNSSDRLNLALQDGAVHGNCRLVHHQAADLMLPTGQLVATDPLVFPERPSFIDSVPSGVFPVFLSLVQIGDVQRVAYAVIRFRSSKPTDWRLMTANQVDRASEHAESLAYPVDSGFGCFMDRSSADILTRLITPHPKTADSFVCHLEDDSFYEMLISKLAEGRRPVWECLNVPLGNANAVVFSSGCGDGFYSTHLGLDSSGEISAVVTDFDVLAGVAGLA